MLLDDVTIAVCVTEVAVSVRKLTWLRGNWWAGEQIGMVKAFAGHVTEGCSCAARHRGRGAMHVPGVAAS